MERTAADVVRAMQQVLRWHALSAAQRARLRYEYMTFLGMEALLPSMVTDEWGVTHATLLELKRYEGTRGMVEEG